MGALPELTKESKWKENISQKDESFCGFVSYDVSVKLPNASLPISISARYPRHRPKFERPTVTEKDLSFLTAKLDPWIQKHFASLNFGEDKSYLSHLNRATALFTYYAYTTCPLDSEKMSLALKLYFWLWFNDDLLENSIYEEENPIDPKTLKSGTDQINAVLQGKPKPFVPVKGYPFFQPLYDSLLELTGEIRKIVKDYDLTVRRLQVFLKRYHEAIRWYVLDKVDGRYSLNHFRFWRRLLAFFDGILEVMCILEGIVLNEEIAESPLLQRLLEVTNNFGGITNDILGMHKEFGTGEKDNSLAFCALEKGIPLEKAVKEACDFLETELSDYLRLKKVIRQEFGNDAMLEKYLDIMDSLIDGHNRMYTHSIRHKSVGFTKLTR